MASAVCPNCSMTFTSAGLLYKHQSKFCVGGPTQPSDIGYRFNYYSSDEDLAKSRVQPHYYTGPEHHRGHSPTESVASVASSMSIHLPQSPYNEERYPKKRIQFDQNNRLRDLANERDHYGKNLQNLHSKQAHLQQQRDEIERRLSRLGEPDGYTQPQLQQTEDRILGEMQRQEHKNQRQLQALRKQLDGLNAGRPNTMGADVLPEIIAMRQAYLRQGGTNPGILAQMADLEAEARAAKDFPQKYSKKVDKSKADDLNAQIREFERENQRLQAELLALQQRNNEHLRSVQKHGDIAALEAQMRARQEEYLKKLSDLEHEMEVTRQEARLERMHRELQQQQQPIAVPVAVPPPAPPLPQPQLVTYESTPFETPAPARYPATTQPVYPTTTQPAYTATQPVYGGEVPYLMTGRRGDVDSDPLLAAPYDQTSGFVMFYDFAIGLDLTTQFVRLVTCLYDKEDQYGEPTMLPSVQSLPESHQYFSHGSQVALISARQPVPRCPSAKDMSLVIELQTTSGGHGSQNRLSTKAWAKLDLFDIHGRLMSGRWRVPMRITPINPVLSTHDLQSVPQFGEAELCMRMVNHRDADAQATSRVNPANLHRYAAQPTASRLSKQLTPAAKYTPPDFLPRTPSTAPRDRSPDPLHGSTPPGKRLEDYDYNPASRTIGFQVDRIKGADLGEGKVRLTAYHKKSGKVVQSETSPVTCTTTAVRSIFKHHYHVYGQQEATFHDVDVKGDMVLLVRFYLRRLLQADGTASEGGAVQDTVYDHETLVAWGALPLMVPRHGDELVNVGTHVVPLYEPPVPDADNIPLKAHWTPKQWNRYNKASARIHVFQGTPRPGSLTPSDFSDEDDDAMPQGAWIPHEKSQLAKETFTASDGIDLYIDGARFLPDSVTISRVAGRLLNRKYEKAGKDINANMQPDCDVYNPVFNQKIEFREPNVHPSSTLLIKLYTVDKFYKRLTVVGYATLNMFVALGTDRQPRVDTGGVQISLNTGAHQLRLYAQGPNGVDPLSATCLEEAGIKPVPCASILVRVYKAPSGRNGRPMDLDRFPKYEWERLGLWKPMPRYTDRVYYSMSCKPTQGECKMLQAQVRRKAMSVRDAIRIVDGAKEARNLSTDKQVAARVKAIVTQTMDQTQSDQDLTFIAAYDPKYGIKVALDGAMNLSWSNFTHATICLNPPGAFYMGQPNGAYDRLKFTRELDMNKSTNKSPEWNDGFFHFPNRAFHKYLTVIIHLQEVSATVHRETYKYGLHNQAWTAVQVFNEGYVNTQQFQLPLFQGPPKVHLLRALAKDPTRHTIVDCVVNDKLKPLEGASVFVRLADGRRDDELPRENRRKQMVQLNIDYIPPNQRDRYAREQIGKDLTALIPPGKSIDGFKKHLADKFKSLVHKVYEESAGRQN